MSRRQFAHLPLLLVVIALTIPAALAALLLRVTFALIRYLHRIYVPELYRARHYAEQDADFTKKLWRYLEDDAFLNGWGNVTECTIPTDEHGWTELPGGFSGHVPCNGWPRIDCPVHPDSEFAERPGQRVAGPYAVFGPGQDERVEAERERRKAIGCTCRVHYFWPDGGAVSRALDCPLHGRRDDEE